MDRLEYKNNNFQLDEVIINVSPTQQIEKMSGTDKSHEISWNVEMKHVPHRILIANIDRTIMV